MLLRKAPGVDWDTSGKGRSFSTNVDVTHRLVCTSMFLGRRFVHSNKDQVLHPFENFGLGPRLLKQKSSVPTRSCALANQGSTLLKSFLLTLSLLFLPLEKVSGRQHCAWTIAGRGFR